MTRLCHGCSGEFVPSRSDARYCSGACRQRAHRQRQARADNTRCPWCSGSGHVDPADTRLLLYAMSLVSRDPGYARAADLFAPVTPGTGTGDDLAEGYRAATLIRNGSAGSSR
ncbi:MAG TPA: hypothetical protein VJT31_37245 [Rugosimonospora sp.]|nr:hypothetical protein [Rugosimonospora sp.]